jgi:enoyl-CoA hydratase/carnithine racemase
MNMATATATLTTSPTAAASSAPALTLSNVVYEKRGAIAYVTVNRPKVLNALNTPTWADLRTAFEDARDDAAVRGVILTGAGGKAFIAGADISELRHRRAVGDRTAGQTMTVLQATRTKASSDATRSARLFLLELSGDRTP